MKEEEEAIETTKILIEFAGDNYIPKQNREKLQILLNLVEKQQKEIERIKSLDIYKFIEEWEAGQLIHKDKIREKIKQLEIVKDTPVKDNSYTYKECIEYGIEELKEVLEEN